MKFRDVRMENKSTIEKVCLILSLAAIFFQIWILSTTMEAFFQGSYARIMPAVFLSFALFLVCALTAWTTRLSFMKGSTEGRTKSYYKDTSFKK